MQRDLKSQNENDYAYMMNMSEILTEPSHIKSAQGVYWTRFQKMHVRGETVAGMSITWKQKKNEIIINKQIWNDIKMKKIKERRREDDFERRSTNLFILADTITQRI